VKIERIQKRSVVHEAIAQIKALIDRGDFRFGGKLPPERELAKLLGISLPSLREALRALSVLGIAEMRHGNGTYLRSSLDVWSHEPFSLLFNLNPSTHLDLFEARIGLEGVIAELAAKKRSQDDLTRMEIALRHMEAHLNDKAGLIRYEFEFHQAIVEAAHNILLRTIMEKLYKLLHESREKTVDLLSDYREVYEEHYLIYEGIRAGKPSAARKAMVTNLLKVEQRFKKAVGEPLQGAVQGCVRSTKRPARNRDS
jgi:GntR family transcriptional regulator, transcriptional repressor for pyruvate dehydrogenase complex